MNYTFKGIDSSTMGVTVITQPQFKTAELRMTFIDIDGRDGSITYPSGYNYYSTEMTIAIEDFDRLEEIRGWMTGSGLFIRSDNPDRYIKVTIDGTIDYTYLQFGIHTAVITLNVYDPFWYEMSWFSNLIRDDFGDFAPYAGSIVTRNKTFPIEAFKGSRNLILGTLDEKELTATLPTSGATSTIDVTNNLAWVSYSGKTWVELK